MTSSPIERTAATFAAVFRRWRTERQFTKKTLAARMGFDPSYLSHVERGRHRPTADFARRAELVLGTGGTLWQAFVDYDDARAGAARARTDAPIEPWRPPASGLVIDQEVARLTYHDGYYRCVVRRILVNTGTEPISRWLARIKVDRYPQEPERSTAYHRAHPLAVADLDLSASCDHGSHEPEPMRWRVRDDWDACKEVWLLFENDTGQFPLYPGERATIEYRYLVPDHLWGPWFERAIRLPTGRLTVQIDLPAVLNPQVWGVETSLSNGETPVRTPVERRAGDERVVFEWLTEAPPVLARYTLRWRFRAADGGPAGPG